MAWDNLVVAVHVSSKRLIWRAPWQEWPSMRPGTTDIAIRTYRGYNDFTMQDWQGFNLVWPIITSGITKSKNPPTDNMVDTLKLSRDKCVMGWNWLNLLHSLQKTTLPMIPGIEIGKSKKDIELHSEWLINNRNLGFTIASRLVCESINSDWVKDFDRILVYNDITEILFLPGMEIDPNFSKLIHYCEDLDIHVNWIPLDSGNLGYWLIPSPQEGIPFLTFEKSQISVPWRILKRSFDLVFSLSLMILLSPVFLTISLAVLVSSGWPIFYSQTRIGYQGKKFKFYKFRSMVKDADKIVSEIENIHENDHVLFKNRKDPRVTPIGRILRKYSLDELPQFLNVLNNTMSVVGPRPALPKEVYAYNSIYERRLNAKPGITGPWQISGRSDLDLGTSISLDLNYMTNWSFSRDLWIVFATVGAIFKGKGAY